jgi:hypothetical protein
MDFGKIGQIAATIVIAAAIAGNLDRLNHWVQVATAKLLWESRSSAWGSPKFWPEIEIKNKKSSNQTKEAPNSKNE